MKSFKEIIKSPLSDWDVASISQLSNTQLEALSILLGIPKSGNKEAKINRLTAAIEVRVVLDLYIKRCSSVEQTINTLAHEYKTKELKDLCRLVGAFCSLSNKCAIATSLVNWRTGCINRGREAYQQVKAQLAKKPKQLSLF